MMIVSREKLPFNLSIMKTDDATSNPLVEVLYMAGHHGTMQTIV